jgi:transcriptional regulator with XRE-family HTH domain
MRFGERVRELRLQRKLTQQKVAEKVGVTVGYISKVEKQRLQFGDYPSEKFIHKLADALQCDEDELLLLLTDRVPPAIQMRVLARPEAFRRIAELDDRTLDRLLDQIGSNRVHVRTP